MAEETKNALITALYEFAFPGVYDKKPSARDMILNARRALKNSGETIDDCNLSGLPKDIKITINWGDRIIELE